MVRKFKGGWEPLVGLQLEELSSAATKFKYHYEKDQLVYHSYYTPDFSITFPDGREIFIEAKGYFRATDRAKLNKVKEANPDLDLRLFFQKDSKIHKNSEMRYSHWCERHDFLYAVGVLPKEWFE